MNTLYTNYSNGRLARSTNSDASSFTAKTPTATKPEGAGIHHFTEANGVPSIIGINPFGVGSENTTFDMRVWGWKKSRIGNSDIWYPTPLLTVSCILGTASGAAIGTSNVMVDTISFVSGDETARIVSPTGNLIAEIMLDLHGSIAIEFDFDMTGATSANALFTTH